MVKSLAVAAAFCASASAFMAPTPLARAPAAQQSGVSFLMVSHREKTLCQAATEHACSGTAGASLPWLLVVCFMARGHSSRQLCAVGGSIDVVSVLCLCVHRRTAVERNVAERPGLNYPLATKQNMIAADAFRRTCMCSCAPPPPRELNEVKFYSGRPLQCVPLASFTLCLSVARTLKTRLG